MWIQKKINLTMEGAFASHKRQQQQQKKFCSSSCSSFCCCHEMWRVSAPEYVIAYYIVTYYYWLHSILKESKAQPSEFWQSFLGKSDPIMREYFWEPCYHANVRFIRFNQVPLHLLTVHCTLEPCSEWVQHSSPQLAPPGPFQFGCGAPFLSQTNL